jgi:hypothetical protein
MKFLKFILVILSLFTLAGCAGTKEMFGIAPDAKGQFFMGPTERDSSNVIIYVYRPKGYAYQPDVFINGTNRSLLAPGAFLQASERPGKVQIVVQANKDLGNWNFKPIGTTFDAKAGERRYFRISAGLSSLIVVPVAGAVGYTGGIEEVPETVALQEMRETRSMR